MKWLIILILFIPIIVNAQIVQLDRCIDGDTASFIVEGENKSTRFLAIDTPEYTTKKEFFGKEASEFTCQKLKSAGVITLEYEADSDLYDRYNRLLAWVFVDDALLQELIIENGMGRVAYLYGDYKYTELLELKEKEAVKNKIGIWSESNQEKELVMIGTSTLLLISLINIIFFHYHRRYKSYLNRIYKYENIYLKTFLILLYVLTVVLVLSDFLIVLNKIKKIGLP